MMHNDVTSRVQMLLHTSYRYSTTLISEFFRLLKRDCWCCPRAVFMIRTDNTTASIVETRTGMKVYHLDSELTPTAAEAKDDGLQFQSRAPIGVVLVIVIVVVDIQKGAKRHGHVGTGELYVVHARSLHNQVYRVLSMRAWIRAFEHFQTRRETCKLYSHLEPSNEDTSPHRLHSEDEVLQRDETKRG